MWRDGKTEDLLNKFFPKFIYSSNKVSNTETRLRDVEIIFRGERVKDFKGNKVTVKEIENHKHLCENILRLSKENSAKLSVNLIKQFYYDLMKECYSEELLIKGEKIGEFKKAYHVGGLHGAVDIEENLTSLIKEINAVEINVDNVLKVISYFYACWLGRGQPFVSGNGRLGRVLFNYLLIGNNFPPIIIFYNDKEKHNFVLEYFKKTNKISKMIEFLED